MQTPQASTRRAAALALAMAGTAGLAWWGQQRASLGRRAEPPDLAGTIPAHIGPWQQLGEPSAIVNPQAKQQLDKIYSEVVARTYVRPGPYGVMLSAAYGHDQRGGLEAHKPEVCYPAQGFTLHEQTDQVTTTPFGPLPVRRLRTSLGSRVEPVTYWFAMADSLNATAFERRMVRLRTMLTGAIPDGILLRISSIDTDSARAWAMHDAFIQDLLRALPSATRQRLLAQATL